MASRKIFTGIKLAVALVAATTLWNNTGLSATSLGVSKSSLGVFGGYGNSSQDVGSAFTLGAKYSTPFSDAFSVGGYFSYLGKGLLNTSTRLFVVAPEATFHLDYYLPGLGLGVKTGLEFVGTTPDTPFSGTYFVVGPHINYDYQIAQEWSVGAEVNALFPFSDSAMTIFDAIGVLKFWF